MTACRVAWGLRARVIALACGAAVLIGESRSSAQDTHRCLTPEVGRVIGDLVTAGGLASALGTEFTVASGTIGGNQIELQIQDAAQRTYGVALAVPESHPGKPDAVGDRFAFFLSSEPSNPRAAAALLAAAAIIDRAVPKTALQECWDPNHPPPRSSAVGPEHHVWERIPRALALTSAVAQSLVLLAALVFGLRAIHALGDASGPARAESGEPRRD